MTRKPIAVPSLRRTRVAAPLALVAFAVLLIGADLELRRATASPLPLLPTPSYRAALVERQSTIDLGRLPLPVEAVLERGETLATLLAEVGVEPGDSRPLLAALAGYLDVRRLRPGQRVIAIVEGDQRPASILVPLEGKGRLQLRREEDGWQDSFQPFQRTVRLRRIEGALSESLDGALRAAEAPGELGPRMADVLQWDLDFHRDLRRGDTFRLLVEEVYLDGRYHELGAIHALEYCNRGRCLEAFRYGDEGGYYDREGRPLRKMFLRSPLPFSRITSRFSQRRFHPILKVRRPHYGVDYGAPAGTPVRVTAGGVVSFAGWDRGGGRTLKVRHPNGYLTAYLHLSRFAAGVRAGVRVSQGQVIGYVGSTGLATAPHLDYRVEHRGRWIDPLSLRGTPAPPIPGDELPRFLAWRDLVRDALESGATSRLGRELGLPSEERLASTGDQAPGVS